MHRFESWSYISYLQECTIIHQIITKNKDILLPCFWILNTSWPRGRKKKASLRIEGEEKEKKIVFEWLGLLGIMHLRWTSVSAGQKMFAGHKRGVENYSSCWICVMYLFLIQSSVGKRGEAEVAEGGWGRLGRG